MDALVAFLRARLDEDERRAKAATPGPWRYNPSKHWRNPEGSDPSFEEHVASGPLGAPVCVAATGPSDHPQSMADAAFIADHDPARVLADVQAKRAVLAETIEPFLHRQGEDYVGNNAWRALRLFALPYATHPDYQPEWRP